MKIILKYLTQIYLFLHNPVKGLIVRKIISCRLTGKPNFLNLILTIIISNFCLLVSTTLPPLSPHASVNGVKS